LKQKPKKTLYKDIFNNLIIFSTEELYEKIGVVIHEKYFGGTDDKIRFSVDNLAPIIDLLHNVQEDLILISNTISTFFPNIEFLDGNNHLKGLSYYCQLGEDSYIEVTINEIFLVIEGEQLYMCRSENTSYTDRNKMKPTRPFIVKFKNDNPKSKYLI